MINRFITPKFIHNFSVNAGSTIQGSYISLEMLNSINEIKHIPKFAFRFLDGKALLSVVDVVFLFIFLFITFTS